MMEMIYNKKLKYITGICLTITLTVILGCSGYDEVPFVDSEAPTTVQVKKADNSLANENEFFVGDPFTLDDVSVTLRNNTTKTISPTWTSSDTTIATVEQVTTTPPAGGRVRFADGKKWVVIAIKPGMVTITGNYSFDNAGVQVSKVITKEFTFKFSANPMLSITSSFTSIQERTSEMMTAECSDDKMMPITGNKINWTSSDASKISFTGATTGPSVEVNALALGSGIVITCTCADTTKGINISKTITLSVTAAPTQREAMISINAHASSFKIGDLLPALTVNFINSSGTVEPITPIWSVNDTSKAMISTSGVLTGIAVGMVTITATYTPAGESAVSDMTIIEVLAAPMELRTRTALLDGRDSYGVDGTVSLIEQSDGSIKIVFGSDFRFGSNIPDPYAYLSKQRHPTSGSNLELFFLKTHPELKDRAGPYEYTLPASVTSIDQYGWIVIFCKQYNTVMDAKQFSN